MRANSKSLVPVLAAATLLGISAAHADATVTEARLQGAWTIDSGLCKETFAFKDGKPRFLKENGMVTSGFIIDGKTVRGLFETCRMVGSRKATDAGKTFNLSCATSVSDLSRSETARFQDDNTLVVFDPKVPDVTITYYRCMP